MNRKKFYIFLGVLFLTCSGLGVVYLIDRERPSVVLKNVGDDTLYDVIIYLGSSTYSLGDIAPGSQAYTTVEVDSACGVEIEFADKDGARKKLDAPGYFAPGVTSHAEYEIDANGVRQFINKDLGIRWFSF